MIPDWVIVVVPPSAWGLINGRVIPGARRFSWRVVMLQDLADLWESFWEMVADIIEGVEGD